MAELDEVRALAHRLMDRHLDVTVWSFGFDTAKLRGGACNFTQRRITLSRYLAARWDMYDIEQTLLHEIAHAMLDPGHNHSREWLALARSIGYVGGTTHRAETATEFARWRGVCPAGHEVLRYRTPKNTRVSCSRCSNRFDPRALIRWEQLR
ncbi:MAG: SprT-like domain-containing protein [Microbacteriaceae bacterium]